MKYEECLSILELLDLASAGAPESARSHVKSCMRCRVLYEHVNRESSAEITIPTKPVVAITRELRDPPPDELSAGQIWSVALGPVNEIVVVIGKSRQLEDAVLAVTVSDETGDATDVDLLVDEGPLGYPFLISAWNFGTIVAEDLNEYLGQLSTEDLNHARALHKYVVTGLGSPPPNVGPPVTSMKDPRREWRHQALERSRRLWRKANARVAALADAPAPMVDPTLSTLLKDVLEGDEWDRTSLLEAAGIAGEHLKAFCRDQLDLTDQADVVPLAKLINALGWSLDEVRPAVERSLWASPGGERKGRGTYERIAARSADVSTTTSNRDIYRGLEEIDSSQPAKGRAIADYLRHLEEASSDP